MEQTIKKYAKKIKDFVNEELGGIRYNEQQYVYRENLHADAFSKGGAYFGFISKNEAPSGVYSDLCLVFFPAKGNNTCLVAFAVGSQGFKNDYQLAYLPGTRRKFLKLVNENGFIKSDFLDIESSIGDYDRIIDDELLKTTVGQYKKCILACQLIDLETDDEIYKGFLARYAELRGWGKNEKKKKIYIDNAEKAINKDREKTKTSEETVMSILEKSKYIVLQGAPGTSKTYTARKIAGVHKVFFKQFHAETTYADFVCGIFPDISSGELRYIEKEGVLVEAIKYASAHPNEDVYLVIDEINRANLSNVLGEAFYLFEKNMTDNGVEVTLSSTCKITRLPENLYVIATMNTADRSLAVVDFALRRRFAWVTMRPEAIEFGENETKKFCKDEFDEIAAIFEKYATDEELNLQPGQGYFIVASEEDMKFRLQYEIMPLIKEYFSEGIMLSAKNEFVAYFRNKIGEEMYR